MRGAVLLVVLGACGFEVTGTSVPRDGQVVADTQVADAAVDTIPFDTPPGISAYRKAITIDHTKVAGADQADFPVWIDITSADLAAHAQANGKDIHFLAADGTTKLDHELASWTPATGRVTAWVRIPSLDHDTDTKIYVRYANPALAPAENPVNVFKANYVAVWHLDDAVNASTIVDATATHAGTPAFTAATTRVAGQLGTGFQFTGSNDKIAFSNPLAGNSEHTISVWVNQAAGVNHTACIVSMGTPTAGQARWLHGHYDNSSVAIGFYARDYTPNPAQVIDGAGWTRLDWVHEGGNNVTRIYKNGVQVANSPSTLNGTIDTQGTAGAIGFAPEPAYGDNTGYEGIIDELRIAKVKRTAGWIATEFANQSSPATFYAVGAEEPLP